MKKEDFKKGQTVWVYLVGNAARYKKTVEERIREWEVVSVGRKYITAKDKANDFVTAQFEIDNNFREKTNYSVDYILYLTKSELLEYVERRQLIRFIEDRIRRNFGEACWHTQLTSDDLKEIVEILEGRNALQ